MARVVFLQPIWYETVGPMYLSASLKARGHECEMFIGRAKKILIEALAHKPDIVCFSVMTAQFPWALQLARHIKMTNPSIITAFGGAHPTFSPEIIEEDAIDIVCVGEGELALAELADKIDAREDTTNIANLHLKHGGAIHRNDVRELVRDLDSLPQPDRSLYYKYKFLADSPEKAFLSGRGCPYDCTFCFNHAYMQRYKGKGPFLRQRKIDNVINEIKEIKLRYPLELVFFQDDTWVLNKKWLYEFLPRYRNEIGIPFVAYVRADIVDEKLISQLKDSGCSIVDMGVETGNENRRNMLLKKNITNAELKNAAELMRKYKLRFRTPNMLGLPGETLENAFETLNLNIDLKPTMTWCSLFQPYPKLELTEYARLNGYLSKEDASDIHGSYRRSLLKMKDIKKIINLQKFFIFTVKFPFSRPLIKRLVHLPNNKIFDIFGFLSHAFMYYRYTKTSFFRLFQEALRTLVDRSYEHVS